MTWLVRNAIPFSVMVSLVTPLANLGAQVTSFTTAPEVFAPWRQDFSAYDTPGLCLAAGRRMFVVSERTIEKQNSFDYLADSHERDTSGAREVAVAARACGAHFTVASTAARDLDDLFHLAIVEQDDSLSLAVLARMISQAVTASERTQIWKVEGVDYLSSEPMRISAVTTLIAQLNVQGPSARVARAFLVDTLGKVLRYYAGEEVGRVYAEQVIALGHSGVLKQEDEVLIERAYAALMWMVLVQHPDSLPIVAQRAQQDLSRYEPVWRTVSTDDIITRLAPAHYTTFIQPTGKPVPQITADYWFPVSSGDTVRPVKGKVNLICMGGNPTLKSDGADYNAEYVGLAGENDGGYANAARMRRWLAKYSAAGLVITIVRPAQGFIDNTPSVRRVFVSSSEEAKYWRWYYQDFEQLPVTVAVLNPKESRFLPPPDGRRIKTMSVGADANSRDGFNPGFEGEDKCKIIGRDGRRVDMDLSFFGNSLFDHEEELQLLLRALPSGTTRQTQNAEKTP